MRLRQGYSRPNFRHHTSGWNAILESLLILTPPTSKTVWVQDLVAVLEQNSPAPAAPADSSRRLEKGKPLPPGGDTACAVCSIVAAVKAPLGDSPQGIARRQSPFPTNGQLITEDAGFSSWRTPSMEMLGTARPHQPSTKTPLTIVADGNRSGRQTGRAYPQADRRTDSTTTKRSSRNPGQALRVWPWMKCAARGNRDRTRSCASSKMHQRLPSGC